jgi:5,10-methylenetetrahydromethanopterin reductase
MSIEISCALAPQRDTPDHVAVAEALGYRRAWLYDSPALYADVWVQLCRAAERTTRIGLGPGVAIPSLRHPMTTAAAIATLVDATGTGRVSVGVGSGFTGRFTLGHKALPWHEVGRYVHCVKALLAGEVTSWEGAKIQMLHPAGFGPSRPIEVPFLIAAAGPKGYALAQEIGDGVFLGGGGARPGRGRQVMLHMGTVLDDHESAGDDRVLAAGGHGVAVAYHFALENGLGVARLPGGDRWTSAYDDVAPDERHLALHRDHLVGVNARDRPFITAEVLEALGGCYRPSRLREVLAGYQAAGVTEVAYQPAGPDIARELDAFMAAAAG